MATDNDFKIKNGLQVENGFLLIGKEAFSSSDGYMGIKTSNMSGINDYMMISGTGDNSTYISAKNGASVYIRGGGNVSAHQLEISSSNAQFYGNLQIDGNLTVNGTTLTVDTTNLQVQDNNITLNYSTGDSSATADGAGITIQDAVDSTTDATILWDSTYDEFGFSHPISVVGNSTFTGSSNDTSMAAVFRNSDSTIILRVRNDGQVLIPSGYLFAQHSSGIYSTGSIKARGGITNDGGNNLSISSGGTDITFNSKNFTSVGTISSGAITSSGDVTIGGSSDAARYISINKAATGENGILFKNAGNNKIKILQDADEHLRIYTNNTGLRMSVLEDGTILAGKSSSSFTTDGMEINQGGTAGKVQISRASSPLSLSNTTDNGNTINIYKGSSQVGAIGIEGGDSLYIQSGTTSGSGLRFHPTLGVISPVRNGAVSSGTISLGTSTQQFKDLYLSGTISSGAVTSTGSSSFGDVAIGGAADSNYDLKVYGLARFQGAANFVDATNPIQVGGTTVIDASRNLTNIGTISSGAITTSGRSTFDRLYVTSNETATSTSGVNFLISDTVSNESFTGVRIDYNASGSQAHTADNSHFAMFVDMDTSQTGGDTTNENRAYGIYADVRGTGDTDLRYALYGYSETEHSSGTVSENAGVLGQGVSDDTGTGRTTANYGGKFLAYEYATGTGGSNSHYGVYGKVLLTSAADKDTNTATGVYGEIELDTTGTATTLTNAYVFQAQFDNDSSDTTINNSYLFYGNYAGTLPTNAYGIYILDVVDNYFGGYVRSATGFKIEGTEVIDSSRNLVNIGTISSGAITSSGGGTFNNETYVRGASNVGLHIQTTAQGTGGSDGLRVGLNSVHAFVWQYEALPLAFATSGTERLSISSTGGFDFKSGNFSNIGTISSGAITSSGTLVSTINGNNTTGGNLLLGATGNNASKWGSVVMRQYNSDTEAEGYSLITGSVASGVNNVVIGGGLDEQNAASVIYFKAASNTSTRNGTEIARINTDGLDIRNNVLRMTGTTVIDASRNLTNIGTISSGAITSNGNLTIKGTQGFNATGETASIYLGDNNSEIRATYDGGTRFFLNGTDRMEIEGGTGNLNLKTGALKINGSAVIDNSRNLTNIAKFDTVLVPRTFNLPNTGGSNNQWVYVGRATGLGQHGASVSLRLHLNSGYNASNAQNAEAFIRFKTSNNSSNQSGFYGDAQLYRFGQNTAAIQQLKVVQASTSEYRFYILVASFTGDNSNYTVEQSSGSWVDVGTFGGTAPTGTLITVDPDRIFTSGFGQNENLDLGSGVMIANSYNIGSTAVIDSSRNIQNVPVIYGSGGSTAIEFNNATYLMLSNPEGARCLYLGDSGDRGNYYDNDTHYFRNAGGGAVRASISGSGLAVNPINNTYNFKAYGQDTDSWFGVYDDANNSANIILTRSDGATMFSVMGHTGATTIAGTLSSETINIGSGYGLQSNGTTVIDSSRNLTNVNISRLRTDIYSPYLSPTNTNTLNAGYGNASDTADMWINYRGYNDGFSYFRDFRIGDGKGTELFFVDGSDRTFRFGGSAVTSPKVAIGNITPTKNLHVYTPNNEGIFLQGTSGGVWMDVQSNSSQLWSMGADGNGWAIYNRNSNTYRLRCENGNDVDIVSGGLKVGGTTVIDSSRNITASTAVIYGGADNKLQLRETTSGTVPWNYIEYRNSANTRNAYIGTNTSGDFQIYGETGMSLLYTNMNFTAGGITNSVSGYQVNGTTVIDSSRNLTNIGTGNFSGKVDFQGDAAIEGGSGYGVFKGYTLNNNHLITSRGIISGSTSSPTITGGHQTTLVEYCNTTDSSGFYFKRSDTGTYTEIARITRAGITSIGNVTAYSDARLKKNVAPISNALEKVQNIRGVTFERVDENNGERQMGVIAQEVEAAGVTEVVKYDEENDVKSVAYGNMVGLLIEAIKEQQQKIEKLEELVEKLISEK